MDAVVQMQMQQAQQMNVKQGTGYFRAQVGAQGMVEVSGVSAQANPFSAMLEQLLGGTQQQDETGMLLEALKEQLDEGGDEDAAMQLLAQLFSTQTGLVQQVDPQLLAQLTQQMTQPTTPAVNTLQQSAMTAMLWQDPAQQASATTGTAAQDATAFFSELAQQTGLEVVQTVAAPQGEAQNAALFGEAGYQRALYQAQQQMNGTSTQTSVQADAVQAVQAGQAGQGSQTEQPMQAKDTKQSAQAEAGVPVPAQAQPFALASESAKAVGQSAEAELENLLAQVKTGLMDGAKKGEDEFVIRLKPEGLGEITVRMAQREGKISMQILASNQNTQRLLSGELGNLRQAMEPYNVVVTAQQTDGGSTSFSMEQQMRQGFDQQQQQQQSSSTRYLYQDDAMDDTAASTLSGMDLASGLDVYT